MKRKNSFTNGIAMNQMICSKSNWKRIEFVCKLSKGPSIINVDSESEGEGASKNGIQSRFYVHKLSRHGNLGDLKSQKLLFDVDYGLKRFFNSKFDFKQRNWVNSGLNNLVFTLNKNLNHDY